jgi:hypothetical protein
MRANSIPGIIVSFFCIQMLIFSILISSSIITNKAYGQITCDPNAGTISRDSSGPAVQALQAILTQLQFDPGPVDGIFGNATEDAVMLFQQG